MRVLFEVLLYPVNYSLAYFNRGIQIEEADESSSLIISFWWTWIDETGHLHMDQIL